MCMNMCKTLRVWPQTCPKQTNVRIDIKRQSSSQRKCCPVNDRFSSEVWCHYKYFIGIRNYPIIVTGNQAFLTLCAHWFFCSHRNGSMHNWKHAWSFCLFFFWKTEALPSPLKIPFTCICGKQKRYFSRFKLTCWTWLGESCVKTRKWFDIQAINKRR